MIKPPRGSNITGTELLSTLLELKDVVSESDSARRKELEGKIEIILDGGLCLDEEAEENKDHDYLSQNIDPFALTVFAGYVARKMRSMKPANNCELCFKALCSLDGAPNQEREAFLLLKSRGGLLKPSQELYDLVHQVRHIFLLFSLL